MIFNRINLPVLLALVLVSGMGCESPKDSEVFCFEDGTCVQPDGTLTTEDGQPICELDNSCGDAGEPGSDPAGNDTGTDPQTEDGQAPLVCTCDQTGSDTDGDCIEDALEPAAHVGAWDFDGDGIGDGCEDKNQNGQRDEVGGVFIETDPGLEDSDGDGLGDGVEDRNLDGRYDASETNPVRSDTDGDGLADGQEDANLNGEVDPWTDTDGDGCFVLGVDVPGESDPRTADSDGDRVPDHYEDRDLSGSYEIGETLTFHIDTDCDGLADGQEDRNRNGVLNTRETDPLNPDTDHDGLLDGVEDADADGVWDIVLETSPLLPDSDGDGLSDGQEDLNLNGLVDGYDDVNDDGCWQPGEAQGESDPRVPDSDGDGIDDSIEDANQDGVCNRVDVINALDPSEMISVLTETCPWLADSDCDGLVDGFEDWNQNGIRDLGELEPRRSDSDYDGLVDGCPEGTAVQLCEDANNDGFVSAGETNPLIPDSDGDGLVDGCEVKFDGEICPDYDCGTNPLLEDTDNDGLTDGEEDANRNCQYDTAGETDPRLFDLPPETLSQAFPEWNVCASQNLNQLTFAASSRPSHDYRLALPALWLETGVDCDVRSEQSCPDGGQCVSGRCAEPAPYFVQPFGVDENSNGFNPQEEADTLWGHLFQSPRMVVQETGDTRILNADIYGFMTLREDDRPLDDILDDVRSQLASQFDSVVEPGALTARPAHDDLPAAPILMAQRQLHLQVDSEQSALSLRNDLLVEGFLGGQSPDPAETPPTVDPVYGDVDCSVIDRCYTNFSIQLQAVQRLAQEGPSGEATVLILVALTPDDASSSYQAARRFDERLASLEDLTDGTALGRFDAQVKKECEGLEQAQAQVDVLWVVDDSRSMQQIIGRLERASRDAQVVLTSNSGIVDFRLAMTTTNPSSVAQTQCVPVCDGTCAAMVPSNDTICDRTCADQTIGCMTFCPANCDANCASVGGGVCDATRCAAGCTLAGDYEQAITTALNAGMNLPGGGGSFYYEDSLYLDCDSRSVDSLDPSSYQRRYFNSCAEEEGFASFFEPVGGRKALSEHGQFLGSEPSALCDTAAMDLSYTIFNSGTACLDDADCYCERLTEVCSDGPRVLSSQICDLIRSMGGLPDLSGQTSSARPHSSPEHGSRSALRALQKLVPALPQDWEPQDSVEAYVAGEHMRLSCSKAEPGCEPCTPGVDVDCTPVPLVTVFLSDEEDFYFKDDCAASAPLADLTPLPLNCRYRDGDPETQEACDLDYCASQNFRTGLPEGYGPDSFGYSTGRDSTQSWRVQESAVCSSDVADRDVTCVGDPCEGIGNEFACNAWDGTQGATCSWNNAGQFCSNVCSLVGNEAACNADNRCKWNEAYTQGVGDPCQMALPLNDCQPCKRLERAQQALDGTGDLAIGFRDVGPVYAIVRNKGEPGYGVPGTATEDRCKGGAITWGRGDGQAYRSMAIGSLGRTQDVCADDYLDFMQRLTADLAILSAPYPLQDSPIASTLKVGISRPQDGGYVYVPVERSRTSGFFYDASRNSIGFKSDPIDGECGGGPCSLDGNLEASEVDFARTASHVPQEGDTVILSYRSWQPVPCLDECSDDETCVRVVCAEDASPGSCTGEDDASCSVGYACEDDSCTLDCTPGELVDRCVPNTSCDSCETLTIESECEPIADTCVCDDSDSIRCDPEGSINSCPMGYACTAGCLCEPIPNCDAGFTPEGTVNSCTEAAACCSLWSEAENVCGGLDSQVACDGDTDCSWAAPVNQCDGLYPTCCEPGETLACDVNEETGEATAYCIPNCTCDPGCNPDTQYCCVECGCECRDNSP